MSTLAPTLQSFFTSYLIGQRGASEHTIAAYRDTLRLLLRYAHERTGVQPSDLDIGDLDAELIAAFLAMLEQRRANGVRTRNARLAAIHSLYRHAALRHPEHAELIARVLAIPPEETRSDGPRLPRRGRGRRAPEEPGPLELDRPARPPDHAHDDHHGGPLSELTGLRRADVHTGKPAAHIASHGKGRKTRITPLDAATAKATRAWMADNQGPGPAPVFTARGTSRKLSTDAVALRLGLHAASAATACPKIATKNVTPHLLRHTCAMRMLAAGIDATTIALWLGHESPESTRAYLHADLQLKQQALDRTAPPNTKHGRYRPARQASRLPRSALIIPSFASQTSHLERRFASNLGITRTSG